MIETLSTADPATGRPLSRAEEAAALGLSVGHYRRLRAAERAGRAEWAPPPLPDGVEGLPHVPIVDGPSSARHRYHYRLDDDRLSRLPLGLMRIGENGAADRTETPGRPSPGPGRLEGRLGIRHFNEIWGERPKDKKPPPKFKPKRPRRKKDVPA